MELTELKGIGPVRAREFVRLGITCAEDLLLYIPRAYKDLSRESTEFSNGEFAFVKATLIKVSTVSLRGGLKKTLASFTSPLGEFNAVWWNMPYISKSLNAYGDYYLFGKAKVIKKVELTNPKIENANNNQRLKGIIPIYKKTGNLNQNTIRDAIRLALDTVHNEFFEGVFENAKEVFSGAHFPQTIGQARECCDKLQAFSLAMYYAATKLEKGEKSPFRYRNFDYANVEKSLCFSFTESQKKSVEEIAKDLNSGIVRRRIVVGDTGSGKSAVAYAAINFAVQNGYQAVIMSPTEILASQHAQNLSTIFDGVLLVTGSTMCAAVKRSIASGEAKVVCGTESVLNKSLDYKSLSIVVIDEQHRFGVRARSLLENKYNAYALSMSATPIPRTQMLRLFGLEFSTVKKRVFEEKRQNFVMNSDKVDGFLDYISKNEKLFAFIVCPRIEDEEGEEMYSATTFFDYCVKKNACGGKIGLLHGGMKNAEKEEVISSFRRGDIRALVSTTVIEVGIDIQRANVMLVLNADRFGMATLHQLRGRIGRNGERSMCFFHTDSENTDVKERLDFISKVQDGGELATYDYERRGGGEAFGLKQSGKSAEYSLKAIALAEQYGDKILANDDLKRVYLAEYHQQYKEALKDVSLS